MIDFRIPVTVPDDVYSPSGWDGNLQVPTKNAIRDKLETYGAMSLVASVTLTGPITGSGTSTIATTIAANVVTFANLISSAYSDDVTLSGNSSVKVLTEHAAKTYIDNSITGLKFKQDCRACPTGNINIANPGTSTFDAILCTSGDRIFLKDQTLPKENGAYQFNGSASPMTRTTDADTGAELVSATFPIREGVNNADRWFTIVTDSITLGTTNIFISQTGGPGLYTTGAGITLTANAFSIEANAITNAMILGSIASSKLLTVQVAQGGTNATSFGTTNGVNYYDGTRLLAASNIIVGATPILNITATSTNQNLVLQAGGSNLAFHKDATPTRTWAIGLSIPGNAAGTDFIISSYAPSAYVEMARFTTTGFFGVGITPISVMHAFGNSVDSIAVRVENAGAAAGTSSAVKSGILAQCGTTGHSVTGWVNALVIESATNGGLVLGAYEASIILFQVSGRVERARLSGTAWTYSDGLNVIVGSTTGTKIGTATSQKIGFWNATPIVQPTTAIAGATFVANTGTAVNDASTFDGYTIKQIAKALRNAGNLA